jgi:hypothetical protein
MLFNNLVTNVRRDNFFKCYLKKLSINGYEAFLFERVILS